MYLLFCVINIDAIKECTQITIILLLVMSYALEIIQLFLFELMHLEDEEFPPIFPAVTKSVRIISVTNDWEKVNTFSTVYTSTRKVGTL